MFKTLVLVGACLLGMLAFSNEVNAQQIRTGVQLQFGTYNPYGYYQYPYSYPYRYQYRTYQYPYQYHYPRGLHYHVVPHNGHWDVYPHIGPDYHYPYNRGFNGHHHHR